MTGSGDEAIFLAERYPHLEIVCFDLDPNNLLDAIRHAREKKIPPKRIRFLFHDARDRLPFDEGYFDGILVNNYSTVGFTEEVLDSFFGEVLRVCGNGARVWIDALFYENSMLLAQFGKQISRFTRLASSQSIGLTPLNRPVLRGASGANFRIYEVVKR